MCLAGPFNSLDGNSPISRGTRLAVVRDRYGPAWHYMHPMLPSFLNLINLKLMIKCFGVFNAMQ